MEIGHRTAVRADRIRRMQWICFLRLLYVMWLSSATFHVNKTFEIWTLQLNENQCGKIRYHIAAWFWKPLGTAIWLSSPQTTGSTKLGSHFSLVSSYLLDTSWSGSMWMPYVHCNPTVACTARMTNLLWPGHTCLSGPSWNVPYALDEDWRTQCVLYLHQLIDELAACVGGLQYSQRVFTSRHTLWTWEHDTTQRERERDTDRQTDRQTDKSKYVLLMATIQVQKRKKPSPVSYANQLDLILWSTLHTRWNVLFSTLKQSHTHL